MGKITLVHPALGERPFDEAHARRMMAKVNTGGWEFKKPSAGKSRLSKSEDAAANTSTDKGEVKVPEEEGDN